MKAATLTVLVAVPVAPCASVAVTVKIFAPANSGTSALQLAVPVAVPLGPRLLAHVTAVTPASSAAVPASVMNGLVAVAGLAAGVAIATVGGVLGPPVAAPGCVTIKVSPAMIRLPVRGLVVMLVATV